ncbi:hypothetical protein [Microbispora sp. ATCC PTA-5024]|uniref:hypothetical protein n=1 Tax=Microbispora sp. ATCC PTA-5024 TaxID=316330 RepID=UPI0003DC8BA5|nr:hypothetical protein [Microbispora sp. ATCC PTA-5024]ETK34060.1 hypothetical protein MPTA5024_21480 [Microbispora sp. ATCC PTA-5024]
MADPLLTGALARVVPALEKLDGERAAAVLLLCRAALDGPSRPRPGGRRPEAPPVPDRWTRLSDLLHDAPGTAQGLAGQIAETTAFGAVRPAAAVREVWELAVPALLAAAARRADLMTLAPLVRAGVFLQAVSSAGDVPERDDRPAPAGLTTRAAWRLAAWQRPDGGFGAPAATADCGWALAEAAVPGLTASQREFAVPLPDGKPPARPRTAHSPPATYGGKE